MAAANRQLIYRVGLPLAGLLVLSSSAFAEKGDAALVLPEPVAAVAPTRAVTEASPAVDAAIPAHAILAHVPLPRPRPVEFAGTKPAEAVAEDETTAGQGQPMLAAVPLPPVRPAVLRDTLPADMASAEPLRGSELPAFVGVDRGGLRSLVARHAALNGIPATLADAVVTVESRYNPRARNGANVGLMQISLPTARSLGYAGPASGLADADTNLTYGVRYLAQAYRLADGDTCRTILKFQGGHRAVSMTAAARSYCTQVQAHTAHLR
jgi:soluble lytic murein transglycosylase-like protein